MSALAIRSEAALATDLDALAARTADLARGSRSKTTWRAYEADWRDFSAWCAPKALDALPAAPITLGLYFTDRADTVSVATLTRRLSAISVKHRLAGHHLDTRHPTIRDVLAGLRRTKGVAPKRVEALTVPVARRVVETCGTRLIDVRDRALMLVGLAGAFRRSELVALDVTDVTVVPDGLRIVVRRSKTDQDGEGEIVGIGRTGASTCPVAAYEAWIAAAPIREGRVFRSLNRHGQIGSALSDRAVALILKRRVAMAGLEPASFSGHSLRSGFATTAASARVEERAIMRTTRHRSTAVLRRYIREGELFDRNVTAEIGL